MLDYDATCRSIHSFRAREAGERERQEGGEQDQKRRKKEKPDKKKKVKSELPVKADLDTNCVPDLTWKWIILKQVPIWCKEYGEEGRLVGAVGYVSLLI